MELSSASALLLCDDPEIVDTVRDALSPVVKFIISAKSNEEAHSRATKQAFDFYILRMKKPQLTNPNSFINWCKAQKNHAALPWIVLGSDVESAVECAKNPRIKCVADPMDLVAVLQILKQVFPPEDAATKARKAQANATPMSIPASKLDPVGLADLRPMLSSVVMTLKGILGQELQRRDAYVRNPQDKFLQADFAGGLLIASEKIQGSMAIHVPKSIVTKLEDTILPAMKAKVRPDRAVEALARLAAMIGENAKKEFKAAGQKGLLVSPDFGCAKHQEQMKTNHEALCLCIPFETTVGKIVVECLIEKAH